jgi:hypothetical protein
MEWEFRLRAVGTKQKKEVFVGGLGKNLNGMENSTVAKLPYLQLGEPHCCQFRIYNDGPDAVGI